MVGRVNKNNGNEVEGKMTDNGFFEDLRQKSSEDEKICRRLLLFNGLLFYISSRINVYTVYISRLYLVKVVDEIMGIRSRIYKFYFYNPCIRIYPAH